jgi:D-sedoheptulose 7-phosphate isomerase
MHTPTSELAGSAVTPPPVATGTAAAYFDKLGQVLATIDRAMVDAAVQCVIDAWVDGRQVITCGNGASALTALQLVNNWNKGILDATGRRLRGRCLLDNLGLVMSYANDVGFAEVFVEQLKLVLEPGDLVIGLSGSGNSENVLRAIDYANRNGACTLGLCGFTGGKLKALAQRALWVNVADMQLTEDVHAMFGHLVVQRLGNRL